jgi:hypothetical protein
MPSTIQQVLAAKGKPPSTENLPEKNDSNHLVNISKKLGNLLENMLAEPHILHRYCLYNKL